MIDKTNWPDGPWMDEPDFEEWIDEVSGYRCEISRHHIEGVLRGYVEVPKGHPLYGMGVEDRIEMALGDVELHPQFGSIPVAVEISRKRDGTVPIGVALKVHGNVNHAGELEGKEGWWFGFDCGHGLDYRPGAFHELKPFVSPDLFERLFDRCEYRDWDYVRKEVESLAEQLLRLG